MVSLNLNVCCLLTHSDSKASQTLECVFSIQGGWDTSGSELSEGELEKRRRTLLEQLDAP